MISKSGKWSGTLSRVVFEGICENGEGFEDLSMVHFVLFLLWVSEPCEDAIEREERDVRVGSGS
jgi:hypothetical protein